MTITITRHTIPIDGAPRAKRTVRNIEGRSTSIVDGPSTLDRILATGTMQAGTSRVMVTGTDPLPAPGTVSADWQLESGYNEAQREPIYRFRNAHNPAHRVEVMRARSWFDDADGKACQMGHWLLSVLIAEHFAGTPVMLATPGATGQDLWLRSIPNGAEFRPPPDRLAALIRTTAGQGRIEVVGTDTETLPALFEYDGRLMYLALMRELPGNAVEWLENSGTGRELMPASLHDRTRCEITVTVPRTWDHVGLVGVKEGRAGWRYPSTPGETFRTWVDGAELALIVKWWGADAIDTVHQRITFERARPLDNLARNLLEIIAKLDSGLYTTKFGADAVIAARAGVRAIALHTVGSLVGKPRAVTRYQSLLEGRPTTGEQHRIEGDQWVWTEYEVNRAPWLVQPHMAAAVWARARVRLLDSPNHTGALHMPRRHLIGFRTDAVYTSHHQAWPDDGKAGRFRLKKAVAGPMLTPRNQLELLAQRDGAF